MSKPCDALQAVCHYNTKWAIELIILKLIDLIKKRVTHHTTKFENIILSESLIAKMRYVAFLVF